MLLRKRFGTRQSPRDGCAPPKALTVELGLLRDAGGRQPWVQKFLWEERVVLTSSALTGTACALCARVNGEV